MHPIAVMGIGGTYFRYAAGTKAGDLLTDVKVEPMESDTLVSQVLDAISELQDSVQEPLAAVSIACRGLINRQQGVIEHIDIQNGGTLYDIPISSHIREEFDIPLYLENDCTAETLAEYRFGAGNAYRTSCHMTIGTGIGAGVVDNNTVIRGESNFAGEVGAIKVGPDDGLECFGISGAWEAYCSGPGILEYVERQLATEERDTVLQNVDDLTTQRIFEVAKEGDSVATDYLNQVSKYNAIGVGILCNAYNPGILTLGGGVVLNNEDFIVDGIERHLDDYLVVDPPEIQITNFREHIAIYGALAQSSLSDDGHQLSQPVGDSV